MRPGRIQADGWSWAGATAIVGGTPHGGLHGCCVGTDGPAVLFDGAFFVVRGRWLESSPSLPINPLPTTCNTHHLCTRIVFVVSRGGWWESARLVLVTQSRHPWRLSCFPMPRDRLRPDGTPMAPPYSRPVALQTITGEYGLHAPLSPQRNGSEYGGARRGSSVPRVLNTPLSRQSNGRRTRQRRAVISLCS